MKIRNVISAFSILLIIVAIAGLGYGTLRYIPEDASLNDTDELVQSHMIKATEAAGAAGEEAAKVKTIRAEYVVDIKGLKEENEDVTAYLNIPDTKISYPVMESEEVAYYLNHDFFNKKSIYGCIFKDTSSDGNEHVTLLHGHNMKNKTMFGSLKYYLDKDYVEAHDLIEYTTETQYSIYKVAAVFTGSTADDTLMSCLLPYSEKDIDILKEKIKKSGTLYEDFTWNDKLLILSTCHGKKKTSRLLLVAKRMDHCEIER